MLSPLLAATLLAAPLLAAAIPPARPNILFIMSDDHGKQAISCYGSSLTPSLAPSLIMTPASTASPVKACALIDQA